MIVLKLGLQILLIVVALSSASGQQASSNFQNLRDAYWDVRSDAFSALFPSGSPTPIKPQEGVPDDVKIALFALLDTENGVVDSGVSLPEEYTEYYARVIAAVASLKDGRAAPGLVGAIRTGGMAIKGVAELGAVAVDPIIQKLSSKDSLTRVAAGHVIVRMLDAPNYPKVSDVSSRSKIKQALIAGLNDEEHHVRLLSVEGLGKLGDPDTVSLITKLATSDPYNQADALRQRGSHPFKTDLFHVRDKANEVLQQLQRK